MRVFVDVSGPIEEALRLVLTELVPQTTLSASEEDADLVVSRDANRLIPHLEKGKRAILLVWDEANRYEVSERFRVFEIIGRDDTSGIIPGMTTYLSNLLQKESL